MQRRPLVLMHSGWRIARGAERPTSSTGLEHMYRRWKRHHLARDPGRASSGDRPRRSR